MQHHQHACLPSAFVFRALCKVMAPICAIQLLDKQLRPGCNTTTICGICVPQRKHWGCLLLQHEARGSLGWHGCLAWRPVLVAPQFHVINYGIQPRGSSCCIQPQPAHAKEFKAHEFFMS